MRDTTPLLQSAFSSEKSTVNRLSSLLSLPTREEFWACWELCRLHNNIGFWVVWLPLAWSIAMVYHAQDELTGLVCLRRAAEYVPLCFGIKCLIMTIDDILDYDIDGKVERTKGRPIPRGSITIDRAWLFFIAQVFIGVFAARSFLSPFSLKVVTVVCPLYIIYPTCKRWMDVAPIPLGIMFKVGVFMGWADLTRDQSIPFDILVPLYIGCCLWTITYETVYQHQDKVDDVKIGIHSPALFVGNWTIPLCTVTGLGFFGLLCYAGYLNQQGPALYLSVSVASLMLFPMLLRTDIDTPSDCKAFFLHTVPIGQVILAGFVLDAVIYRVTNDIPL